MESLIGVDPSLYGIGNTPAFLIWQIMQGFANTMAIIVLLAIIVSQITGIGINNYGIKKMLPKLIVVAILINLSFIICEVAIDVSNIVGQGLIGIGRGIANQVGGELSMNGLSLTFGSFFTAIFGTAAGAAVVAPIAVEMLSVSAFGTLFMLIPLIFVAISAIISFVIFLLLLAGRQLLAVVLVAIAPLALVCYILPNTEFLFKKWREAFKAILIVYPVCSAVYVVSRLVQIVAFNSDGIHPLLAMVALIASFVPLAVAPMLIRRSISSFGELGNMISRMGDRARSGVSNLQSQFRNSEVYRQAQRDTMDVRNRRRVEAINQVMNDRDHATRAQRFRYRMATFGGGDRVATRVLANSQQAVARHEAENVEAERVAMRTQTGNYNVEMMGEQLNRLLDNYDNLGDNDRMRVRALMSQLSQQSGGAKKIYNAVNGRTGSAARAVGEYMAQNEKVRAALESKSRRTASRISDIASGAVGDNTTQAQYDNMNNAYLDYLRREAASGNRNVMNQSDWIRSETRAGRTVGGDTVIQSIANNVLDKDKDLVTQSGAEVQELINHISQDRINSIAANSQLLDQGDIAEGVKAEFARKASAEYTDNNGNLVKIRSIEKDGNGQVIGFEVDYGNGSGWLQIRGNMDGYSQRTDSGNGTDPYIEQRIRSLGIDPNSEYANQMRRGGIGGM